MSVAILYNMVLIIVSECLIAYICRQSKLRMDYQLVGAIQGFASKGFEREKA